MQFPIQRSKVSEQLFRSLDENVRLISGPATVPADPDTLIVACTVRNGMPHLRQFLDHYQRLAKSVKLHFVFMDNGSTDGTREECSVLPNATVLATDVPYKTHFIVMSQYLAERFGRSGWVLIADIDEHFDFPCSEKIGLKGLLRYLNKNGYTTVPVQMLDMFALEGLARVPKAGECFQEVYRYFDISDLRRIDYRYGSDNLVANLDIPFYAGGLRKKIFGLDQIYLTKHPLLFYADPKTSLVDPHSVMNSRIADISGVFFHYKFVPGFTEYVQDSVQLGNHWNDSYEYKQYLRGIEKNPNLDKHLENAVRFESVEQLVKLGFLHVSRKYSDFCVGYIDT